MAKRRCARHAVAMTFRPALRPGAPLLRRDAAHLQIGTSPGIVLRDRPGLLALLHLLDGARDMATIESLVRANAPELDSEPAVVLAELRSLGAVFDASCWAAPRWGLEAEARHADLAGDEPGRIRARAQYGLAFHSDSTGRSLVDSVRVVLADSGITDVESDDPDLLVIASGGEPSRSVFDRPLAGHIDHLPLVIDENRVRIGPLVRPGRTPCVSCHDLHRADWDRAWPALLPQFGRHTGALTPPAVSAVTAHAAAVELAVEVLALCDGRTPRTIGQCLAIGPGHDERAIWPIAFHHGCACDLLSAA